MYNYEIKERFAKSHTNKPGVRIFYRQLFDIAQKYEEQWGADLCTKTSEELQPLIDEMSGLTAQSRRTTLFTLKSYIKWCLSQDDISGVCDDLLSVDRVTSNKFKTQSVTSPMHLQKYLDSVFPPEEDRTIDILYRTYFWLAYAGVSQNDIFKIRNKDVDFSEMVVRYNGKEYPIYREGVKAIRFCVDLDYIQSFRTDTGKFRKNNRVDSDLIMRSVKSVITSGTMIERISRKQKAALDDGRTNLKLSFFKVWISGLFYRVYMDELSGIKPDFHPFIKEINSAKTTKNKEGHLNRRAEYYYEDYMCWKDSLNN